MFCRNHWRVIEEDWQLWFQNFFSWGCLREISFWVKIYNFTSVSVSYNCWHDTTRNETHCRCYSPAGNYMFKVNNRNTRTRCEICSKLTIKTPERRQGSLRSLWQKWSFISYDTISCKHYPKWSHMKGTSIHAFISSKQKWLAFTE